MAQIAFVDWDGLVYYDSKNKQYIADKLAPCLKNGGVIKFKDLPKPSFANLNYIYIISDDFISDDNFIDNTPTRYRSNSTIIVIEDPQLGYRYSVIKTQAANGDYTDLHNRIDDLTNDLLDISKNLLEVTNDLANEHERVDALEERVNNLSPGGSGESPDLEGYATVDYVDKNFAKKTDVANYITENDVRELIKTEIPVPDLSDYYTIDQVDDLIPSLDGYAKTSDIPNVSNFITMSDVESKKYLVESDIEGKLDVDTYNNDKSKFALKSDIPPVPTKTSDLTNDSGFLTEHQDISGKVDKTTYDVDKATFSLKSEVEAALGNKANNILFTEDYKVSNPIGKIDSNYDVKGKTIAQLLIDLLGLELEDPGDTPTSNAHEDSTIVVKTLIDNKTPTYTLDGSGNLIESIYSGSFYRQMSPEKAKENSNENYFYQIIDNDGNLIESGYSIKTIEDNEAWLTIALPSDIKLEQCIIKQYDPSNPEGPQWSTSNNANFVLNSNYSIDGYFVYSVEGVDGGATYRVVINN